jgi:putative transposase
LRVSKAAVWKWVVKLREKLQIASERKAGRFVAVDETCVKVNGEQYWVYSALDRNELVSMRVYPARNSLTTESFIRSVLKYCDGKPEFVVDNAPWLREAHYRAWTNISPSSPRAEKPNRINLLIL